MPVPSGLVDSECRREGDRERGRQSTVHRGTQELLGQSRQPCGNVSPRVATSYN